MDNATRRQLLEQAKQVGYTGSILDVFQNPQVLDQFVQEQQQVQQQPQQPQQQMQVEMPTPPATTPNYKVAQPRQSEAQPLVMSNTEVPIQIRRNGGIKFDLGGPTDPSKKQIKRASDEELMFGMRPTVAVQDNTYVTTPRIEEAKRDDDKGVTPQQKQKAATIKKKIVAEEKRQQLVNDLSNQGTISPATEGSERLKNQFIYAMDQPLDALGSAIQRGYVPQGNLNGDYETASPMSSIIGAFNPLSAVMDVARVGRDLGEKETYTTLSGAGELGLHALGILPSVQLGKQLGKKAIKEAVYWGVEPIGYGVKQKLAYFPANLIKYGYHGLQGNATKVKLKTLESIMDNYDKMGGAIVQGRPYKYEAFKDGIRTLYNPKGSRGYEREAQRRLDAWNTTWNKDQLFDTFTKIGENKYVLNAAKYGMDPEQLNSIVSDVEANKLNRLFKKNQISPEEYDASLKALTLKQSWDPQYANESIESIKSSILKNPENFKDIYHYDPIRKGGATSGYLKDEGYTDVVSASDEFGVRGGFLYHTKPNPDGTIHLRAHDTWDFNPWAKRGQIKNVENENARKYNDRNVINMLKDIDPIQILGGKPYDIENNYIFDPVTREIMASYKTGGKKCYTCNQSKLQVLYNKRNYKK